MKLQHQILIAEDDEAMAALLAELAQECGFRSLIASTGEQAVQQLQSGTINVLLTDLRLPPPDGLALLALARQIETDMPVVLITGHATVHTAVDAFRNGAFDLVTKPFDTEQVRAVLRRIRTLLEHRQRIDWLTTRLQQLDNGEITPICLSTAMKKVMELVHKVANIDVPVLLIGETGTGKEVIARTIHRMSHRAERPFFSLNCAAISASLMESELFGHEKGAFTGATRCKRGLLELANGGTLLLDEINSTDPKIQARLLQFIQNRQVIHVGGERVIDVDVRLICAGNQPLEELVKEKQFREDLYYRLNVYPIDLPPLRERQPDIIALAETFMVKFARELDRPAKHFSETALKWLQAYRWPGNVRELENIVQRAVVLTPQEIITEQYLPQDIQPMPNADLSALASVLPDNATLAQVEKFWIAQTLKNCRNNKSEAARQLGIDPSTLFRKLKQ